MMSRSRLPRGARSLAALVLMVGLASTGCAASAETAFNAPQAEKPTRRGPDGVVDDRSRCDWKNRQDRETVETAGPGSLMPNVRRVFAIVGQGNDRQRVLVCREVDTNLDGVKDVVRLYTDKGESLSEEADANFDGEYDTRVFFSKGRLVREELDKDFNGKFDEWKYYSSGRIARAERDLDGDTKKDIWEMYASDGTLERIGVDVDHDERVDRWDQDTEVRKAREEKERLAEEEERRKADAKAEAERKEAEEAEAQSGDGKKRDRRPASKKAEARRTKSGDAE